MRCTLLHGWHITLAADMDGLSSPSETAIRLLSYNETIDRLVKAS